MLWRLNAFGLMLVCSVLILILLMNHWLDINTSIQDKTGFMKTIQSWRNSDDSRQELKHKMNNSIALEINAILDKQLRLIGLDMEDYNYTKIRHLNKLIRGLPDLVPELGGIPMRSVIITTFRSGSSFLGGILNSHPGTFYHYEPLMDFPKRIRGPPDDKSAVAALENMLNCNYSELGRYLQYCKQNPRQAGRNVRHMQHCRAHKKLCWHPEFLSPFCRLFPFHAMKVVRLRLNLIEKWFSDKRLNVRVLLLVRDPRGTLQSRKHLPWCIGRDDCDHPGFLCADLVSDYVAACRFSALYPDRFMVVRYEELSLDPYGYAQKIFEFYGLDFHPDVRQFLDNHTKAKRDDNPYSTFRNSSSTPFHWRQELSEIEVNRIQDKCGMTMQYWGYVKSHNLTHQKQLNPIRPYSLIRTHYDEST